MRALLFTPNQRQPLYFVLLQTLLLVACWSTVPLTMADEIPVVGVAQEVKEEHHIVGGWSDLDPKSEQVQELLPKVMAKLNQQSNDAYHMMPVKVLKASVQVVAGLNYKLEIQAARSECKKSAGDNVDLKNCKKLEGHPEQVYTVEVWEKAWENFLQVKILNTKTLS